MQNSQMVEPPPSVEPLISVIVTFLKPEDGGRQLPVIDSRQYMPHLVVGDAGQRAESEEDYLGVRFTGDGRQLPAGHEHQLVLELMYPGVDYSRLVKGARFTIREGSKIVGFGRVMDPPQNRTRL